MSSSSTKGVGFLGLLTLLFIAYKLAGIIAWSWLLVLAPLWIPLAIAAVAFILAVIVQAVSKP